ncbi:MAG: DUF2059 domain-containing protein [Cyanobacteria bacterium P01_D01_bin.156]
MKTLSQKILGLFFVITLLLSIAQPVFSAETPQTETTKIEQIEELLELTGSEDQYVQIMDLVIGSVKQSFPDVPDTWWEKFLAKVDPTELDALVARIYDKYFTIEEINALIEFNRTPVGQAINAKMPLVMQESFIVGQAWGQNLAEEVLQELKAEGYTI